MAQALVNTVKARPAPLPPPMHTRIPAALQPMPAPVLVPDLAAQRSFRAAATRYLQETQKASLIDDAGHLRLLEPFIGDLPLGHVHMATLQPFIKARQQQGVKSATINHGLQVVRRIINLAAGEWFDNESGLPWLQHRPNIRFLPTHDRRDPYPLSFEEQARLLAELPPHLARMARFKLNTGCREHEVCALRWQWLVDVPELNTQVFLIPGSESKNGDERLIMLNREARAVLEEVRQQHPQSVFIYQGHAIQKMNGHAWRKARKRAGLEPVRVHDLRHTFGRRLRAAGVSLEDRQDLLGHRSGRVTTHYSAAELGNLLEAAEKVCGEQGNTPTLTILKRRIGR